MNLRLLLAAVWLLAGPVAPATAQTAAGPDADAQFSLDGTTGNYTFSWWGVAGRTYFLQQSSDLLNWTYLQDIESGADQPIQVSILSAAPRLFLRLRYTDVPTSDPLNDDFDGDGVSNWNELLQGTDPLVANLDTNGLPYDWEQFYGIPFGTDPDAPAPRGDGLTYRQAFQQGVNPLDFYNGQTPVLAKVSGDGQTGNPGSYVPEPLVVQVTDSYGGPVSNAPVTFTLSSGGGQLQKTVNDVASVSLTVLTDSYGQARAFFRSPNAVSNTSRVAVAAGSVVHLYPSQTAFAESTGGSFPSPNLPGNVVAAMNPDGSGDVSWTNNADPGDQTPTEVRYMDADGHWITLATVPAGAATYHIPAQ